MRREQIKNESAATTRALVVLTEDARRLAEFVERVRAQIDALAVRHGIEPPAA